MLNVIVKKIDIQTKEDNVLLELILCNTQDDTYFLEKRFAFQFDDKVLNGFKVTNNDKKISYMGRKEKLWPSSFPDDYIEIKPKACVTLSIFFNQFFSIKQNQEYFIDYKIRNFNPTSNKIDVIEFKNHMVQIE